MNDGGTDDAAPFLPKREGRAYYLTTFVFLRWLGFVYFFAFLSAARQALPLLGHDGVLPMQAYFDHVAAIYGGASGGFWKLPSLFWLNASDTLLRSAGWLGAVLSFLVMVGLTNAGVMFVLWALYLSFVHGGQIFYGYGSEIQLCETGFLAMFLCPLATFGPFPKTRPPKVSIYLCRWLVARVMLGAGLIKLRGDPCWRDLTCLVTHWETQPLPNPVSWLLNQAPLDFQRGGVVLNHAVEVIAPFFAFGPRRARIVAGCMFIGFQLFLIVSGNLSFLNYLTIAPAIACLDDDFFERVLPKRLTSRVLAAREAARDAPLRRHFAAGYAVVVGVLSLGPIDNILSARQAMNRSFEPFALVNTYGAFGSVDKQRIQVVLEGTSDDPASPDARWLEYELPCAPGDPDRRPCVVAPYQPRLDWQIWFLRWGEWQDSEWLVRLTGKLLQNDRGVLALFAKNPFPDAPPRAIRAVAYAYRFTTFGEGPAWWVRRKVRIYMPPRSLGDAFIERVMREP